MSISTWGSALVCSALLLGCSTAPLTDAERNQNERVMEALNLLNAQYGTARPYSRPASVPAGIALLRGHYMSGQNRICVYNWLGGDYVITQSGAAFCPQATSVPMR